MLNERPIFLNTFSKGGSNLVWNVFQSHPDMVSPVGETQEAFSDLAGRLVTALMTRELDYWGINNVSPRRRAPDAYLRFVDKRLFASKLGTMEHPDNREKRPGVDYTAEEIRRARLVSKSHNGQVFLTEDLSRAYPGATFFAIPRDGFALCEAYMRRGRVRTAEEFARQYNSIAGRMLRNSRSRANYRLVRFEDLFSPAFDEQLAGMFEFAGLDLAALDGRIRLKAKQSLPVEETERLRSHWRSREEAAYAIGSKHWIKMEDIGKFVDFRINDFGHERISASDRDVVKRIAGDVMSELGYI